MSCPNSYQEYQIMHTRTVQRGRSSGSPWWACAIRVKRRDWRAYRKRPSGILFIS